MRPNGNADVLLPLGLMNMFFATEGDPKVPTGGSFTFDNRGEPFLLQELLALGGTRFRSVPLRGSFQFDEIGKRYVRDIDSSGDVADRTRTLLRPVAEAIGLDPSKLRPLDLVMVGGEYALSLSGDQRARFSSLSLVYNSVFQLLLGIRENIQIDVPTGLTNLHLRRLLDQCGQHSAGYTVGKLLGIFSSYVPVSMDAPLANSLLSNASAVQAEAFKEWLDDATYLEFSRTRAELGWLERQSQAIKRAGILARRVVASKLFRESFRLGQKVTKLVTSVPVDALEIDPLLAQSRFLPPIVDLSPAVATARSRLLVTRPEGSAFISFDVPGLEWLSQRYALANVRAEISANRVAFLKQYKANDGDRTFSLDELKPEDAEAVLYRHVARRAPAPIQCATHDAAVDPTGLEISWPRGKITFAVAACCEEAARAAFASMLSVSD